MPTSPTDMLWDPEFHAMPLGSRLSVMRTADPEFAAMDPKTQGTILARAQQKVTGTDKYAADPPQDEGFVSRLGSNVWGALKGLTPGPRDHNAPINPPPSAKPTPAQPGLLDSLGAAQHEQFQQGREMMAKPGVVNKIAGAGHYAAGALPVLGPAAAQVGDELGDGRYGMAAADGLMLLGPEAAKLAPAKVSVPLRSIRNVNNPVEERALASVEPNVRMTPGQRTGATGLQKVEKNLVNLPGSQNAAEDFYRGQQQDLAAEGRRRIQTLPGTGAGTAIPSTNNYGAGTTVQSALTTRVQDLKKYADKLYDSTRQSTARNQKLVPGAAGTNWEYDAATGYDAPREFTTLTPMETPVALGPIRAQLKPLYTELKRSLPDAKRATSPAWQSLEDLMTSGDTHMNAADFDRTLGAVKSISRNGDSPLLSTQTQRLAKNVIAAGEDQFQKAMAGAGPNVAGKLANARKAVAEYHNTADFLGDLNSEPAAVYDRLTQGKDLVTDTLGYLNQKAPQALKTVGKTFLEGLMDKATREGGWSRSEGVLADWTRMGPETKQMLFGPQLTRNMDDFLLAAKRLKTAEGSATAGRLAAIAGHGEIGLALWTFLHGAATGNELGGALEAGGLLTATHVAPALLARISFKPAGATLLKYALTLPVKSPAFDTVMKRLNAMAGGAAAVDLNRDQRPDPLSLNQHLGQQ